MQEGKVLVGDSIPKSLGAKKLGSVPESKNVCVEKRKDFVIEHYHCVLCGKVFFKCNPNMCCVSCGGGLSL